MNNLSTMTLLLMQVDSIAVLANAVCSWLLWRHRKDVPDRSRYILAIVFMLAVPPFSLKVATLMTHGMDSRFMEVLAISPVFGSVFTIGLMMAYAIEVMRPGWIHGRQALCVLTLLVAVNALMATVLKDWFTPLHSFADLKAHIGEANVLLRLAFISITSFIAILLLYIPYQWRTSSADKRWIVTYVGLSIGIGLPFFTWILTLWMPAHIVHNLFPTIYALYYTYYELHERIASPTATVVAEPLPDAAPQHSLWQRIEYELNQQQIWRNPDVNIDLLSRLAGSNRTYVGQCLKEHTSMSLNEYINRQRITFVAEQLHDNPTQNLTQLFFTAGYRSRTTAWRNFVQYIGQSPTQYIASLT